MLNSIRKRDLKRRAAVLPIGDEWPVQLALFERVALGLFFVGIILGDFAGVRFALEQEPSVIGLGELLLEYRLGLRLGFRLAKRLAKWLIG
mgnify:CR=1 FL=1